jgi:uncharacterized protein (DUF58 family)
VKQFEADTNANVVVALDISRSMRFSSRSVSKLDYGRFLAASLIYFSHKQRDRVGLVTFDAGIVEYVPPSAKHLEYALYALDRVGEARPGSLAAPLLSVTERLRRRGLVAIISDLYDEPAAVVNAVKPLKASGHDVVVFHVLDPAELEFPFAETASFEDLETGERLPIVPDALREQYRALVRGHVEALGSRLTDLRIDYSLFDTSVPLDHALFRYLSTRERLSRAR